MKELVQQFDKVLFERDGGVAYLTLNDPANKNPVTVEMMADLNNCRMYVRDDSIRAIVIRGAGGAFSAGGNIKVMKDRIDKGINRSGGYTRRRRVHNASAQYPQAHHCRGRGRSGRCGHEHCNGLRLLHCRSR
ncbi:MAG: enoyl-CoA hydratase-related protein [Oscillospiraceae bacterium]